MVYEAFVDIPLEGGFLVTVIDAIKFVASNSNDLPLTNNPTISVDHLCAFWESAQVMVELFGFGQFDFGILELLLLRSGAGNTPTEHQIVKRLAAESWKHGGALVLAVDSAALKEHPHLLCQIFFIYDAIDSLVQFLQRLPPIEHVLLCTFLMELVTAQQQQSNLHYHSLRLNLQLTRNKCKGMQEDEGIVLLEPPLGRTSSELVPIDGSIDEQAMDGGGEMIFGSQHVQILSVMFECSLTECGYLMVGGGEGCFVLVEYGEADEILLQQA